MSITEKFRFKHLQPSQFEGWLRRAEKANEGDDDYHDWDHMPKDYRACCNFALEMKDALEELLSLRATHKRLLDAAKLVEDLLVNERKYRAFEVIQEAIADAAPKEPEK